MTIWEAPRYVIVPTRGRACLQDCLAAISNQVDEGVLINTDPDVDRPPVDYDRLSAHFAVVPDFKGPNISRWWNAGFDWCAEDAAIKGYSTWDVAVLNDDVIVPENWFTIVAETMRRSGLAAGCSGGITPIPTTLTEACKVPIMQRMQGFAFIMRGELGLRACEEIPWYGSDDYMDVQARLAGGMVMVPGYHVNHLYPNHYLSTVPGLHELNGPGMEVLVRKIGYHPFL